MPRYKLTLEYTGTRYSGWQIQKNARTVQGELQRAIAVVIDGTPLELYGSGRTDAGVHALAQVAHVELLASMPPDVLRMKLNDELPSDVHVLAVQPVGRRFHARHGALVAQLPVPDLAPADRPRQAVRLVDQGRPRRAADGGGGGAVPGHARLPVLHRPRSRGGLDPRAPRGVRGGGGGRACPRARRGLALPLEDGAAAGGRAGRGGRGTPGHRRRRRLPERALGRARPAHRAAVGPLPRGRVLRRRAGPAAVARGGARSRVHGAEGGFGRGRERDGAAAAPPRGRRP